MPITALVTGGNGFIGRYIVEQLLARGDRVRVIGRNRYPDLEQLGVACFQTDLGAEQDCSAALTGCEVVFHVAAQAGVWGSDADFQRNNVTATEHLVRQAIRAGVPKLVYTSSPSVVIGTTDLEGVDESTPYPERYLTAYPRTKAQAERFVLAQREILTVAIRPHLVWGPRDPHLIPRLLARARAGRLTQVGPGRNKVDVTYVENAALAHILAADALAADSALCGRPYFIGQDTPVYVWEFINTILQRVGIPPVRRKIPYAAALRIAGVVEDTYRLLGIRAEPPLTRFTTTQLALSHWFDHRAAARDFGYHARVSTEEGLQRLVAALNNEGTTEQRTKGTKAPGTGN